MRQLTQLPAACAPLLDAPLVVGAYTASAAAAGPLLPPLLLLPLQLPLQLLLLVGPV